MFFMIWMLLGVQKVRQFLCVWETYNPEFMGAGVYPSTLANQSHTFQAR